MVLVAQCGGGSEEEGGRDHERDEGETEEEEGVGGELTAVEGPDAFREGEGVGGTGWAEGVGGEGRHGGEIADDEGCGSSSMMDVRYGDGLDIT